MLPGDSAHGGGGAEIDNDEVAIRIQLDRADCVGDAVRADFLGILVGDAQPGFYSRAHDQRLDIEIFLRAGAQRIEHVGHNRADGDVFHELGRYTVFPQSPAQKHA